MLLYTCKGMKQRSFLLNSWIADTTCRITTQLRLLWNKKMVELLFVRLPELDADHGEAEAARASSHKKTNQKGFSSGFLLL